MSTKKHSCVVRFAPSPTGPLHVGGVRTALFNYLFAKQHNGKLILRIEDTDKERSKKEYEDDIQESFKWLKISFDESARQSERGDLHRKHLEALLTSGKAYISKEEESGEGKRAEVIRFKNPNKKITFTDLIKGEITFDTTELKDFVIAKSIDEPIFHFAVVVDDFLMGVTHIIRGEDHISNTPRQILIQEALGAPRPEYANLPLILAPDRSKLSKRKHGESVSVKFYRERGYLPEALLNFLALIGWNPGDDREILDLKELIELFDLSHVQKSGAIFDSEKLNWMNKEYLEKVFREQKILPHQVLPSALIEGKTDVQTALLFGTLFERIHRLSEIEEAFKAGVYDYFFKKPDYSSDLLLWKKDPDAEKTKVRLEKVKELLTHVSEKEYTPETIKKSIWDFAEKEGRGEVLWPLRTALSGKKESPDPFTLAAILGKKEVSERIDVALSKLAQ